MRFLSIFIFLLIGTFLFSQKKLSPEEKSNLVEQLKKNHKEKSVAALTAEIRVEFELDKKNNLVQAITQTKQHLIALTAGSTHLVYDFFDEKSEIKNIVVKQSNGKSKSISEKREYFDQNGIFYSDAQVCHFSLEFPTEGHEFIVKKEKHYDDFKYFPSLYFTEPFPILEQKVVFAIPDWLELELKPFNFEGRNIKKEETYDAKNNVRILTFTMKNLPGNQSENNVAGNSYLYPHVLILFKSFETKNGKTTVFESLDGLYAWYSSLVGSVKNDKTVIKTLAEKLTATAQTEEEKIKNIYYWVQNNIRYIAFEDGIAGYKPDAAQNVLEKRYGDCKGMANLTKEMLQSIGFDARLTWIGTHHLAYDYSTPCLAVDNHMICAVQHEGTWHYLDATEEFNELGHYAERIQGRQVLIENEASFHLETIPATTHSNNKETILKTLKIEDETLVGNAKRTYAGDSKAYVLIQYHNLRNTWKEEALQYYLSRSDLNYKVSKIETSDLSQRDGIMTMNYDLEWKNAVASFGDDLYISLDFDRAFADFKFDEDREHGYLFEHKTHRVFEVELDIPEGYQVTNLPKQIEEIHPNFEIKAGYTQEAGKIKYRKEIAFPIREIKKTDFDLWNTTVQKLNAFYDEQLVLTKQ